MEKVLEAVIPGKPRGQGSMTLWRGDDGRERAKYGRDTVDHRNLAITVLGHAWAGRPALTGPIGVGIDARFPRPKHHYGTGRNAGVLKASAPTFVTTPSDGDKIARLIDDALTIAGVVQDDAQVARLEVVKVYADDSAPGTTVRVFTL
jgi:crossover junction endodeoxyribonuclease RusA